MPPAARATWERINSNLQTQSSLMASIEAAGIAARVINTPSAFIEDADGNVPAGAEQRINDQMGELAGKLPGKLYGLATVDAFTGDAGARELTRAVKELKLRGVFVESAKRDLVLGTKETRPTLAAAASLGVPVFVHPLTDRQLHTRFSRTGRMGLRFARGTINSAALISMLEGGTFDEAPKLQVVMTTLAMGGILLAALVRCSIESLTYHARRAGHAVVAAGEGSGRVTKRQSDGRYAFVELQVRVDAELKPRARETEELVARAERDCFVGASLTVTPAYEWNLA